MKILLFGNLGSGKTTISKEMVRANAHWEYLAIDDFRRRIGDNTIKGDSKAKSAFVKSILHDDTCQLIECTGLGRLGSSVFRRLQKYEGKLVVIVLSVPLENCLERISERKWDIPFPENIMKGSEMVQKLDKLYRSNFLFDRWSLRSDTIFIQVMNDSDTDLESVKEIMNVYMNLNFQE